MANQAYLLTVKYSGNKTGHFHHTASSKEEARKFVTAIFRPLKGRVVNVQKYPFQGSAIGGASTSAKGFHALF
jgi:hypothetical protein